MSGIGNLFEGRRRPGFKTECEAVDHLRNKGWKVARQDLRILGVQVDILARNLQGELVLVEVKSMRAFDFDVISHQQLRRLQKVQEYLCEREPTHLLVMVREPNGFCEILIED